jgi:hypothetical protein
MLEYNKQDCICNFLPLVACFLQKQSQFSKLLQEACLLRLNLRISLYRPLVSHLLFRGFTEIPLHVHKHRLWRNEA